MVIVPSVSPVAVSVMAAIFALVSFAPKIFTVMSSRAFLSSTVETISTVRLWIFSSYWEFSVSHTPETRGEICATPSIKLNPSRIKSRTALSRILRMFKMVSGRNSERSFVIRAAMSSFLCVGECE